MERTGGTFTLEDVYVAATDDHVLAVQRYGASLDGVQVERFIHIHDIEAFDDFFSRF